MWSLHRLAVIIQQYAIDKAVNISLRNIVNLYLLSLTLSRMHEARIVLYLAHYNIRQSFVWLRTMSQKQPKIDCYAYTTYGNIATVNNSRSSAR